MAKFDHHIHTSRHSPDSVIDPFVLLDRAKQAGLDGVVITEHDYLWEAHEVAELAARARPMNLKVFAGVEVSTREGHFLVYGLPDPFEAPPGIALKDLLKVVRGRGAAVVAAHPYRFDQDFTAIVAKHGPAFDALERVSNNITPDVRRKIEAMSAQHPSMGATGSSDAHEPKVVGCYYTEFPGEINTLAEFVAALHAKLGRPRHRPGGPKTSGPID